jgi:hypothetical protein
MRSQIGKVGDSRKGSYQKGTKKKSDNRGVYLSSWLMGLNINVLEMEIKSTKGKSTEKELI